MSATANIDFDWADGHYTFRLAIGQLIELEEKCKAGPQELYARLVNGTWRVMDLREILRLGLVGGGLAAPAALSLVRRYVEERPLTESLRPAIAVLAAALVGVPEDQPGADAEKTKRRGRKAAPSPQDASMAPAPH